LVFDSFLGCSCTLRGTTIMKKAFVIFLSLIIIGILIGMRYNSKNSVTSESTPYLPETAIANGDIVKTNGGKQYNVEKLQKFFEHVKNDKKDKVRITRYTTEGGAIIMDLENDGKRINYTFDTTRDGMGERKIVKKKFKSDSLYKSGSLYYLKDRSGDIQIY
jgi:hypothetical protein